MGADGSFGLGLASALVAGLMSMGCAETPQMLPAQNPGNLTYPYPAQGPLQPAPAPAPLPAQAESQLIVTPVFWVPSDVVLDPQTEAYMTGLITSHLALARERYTKLLVVDTFQFTIDQPISYHTRLTTDELEASQPDSAHTMARELLAWRHEDRMSSRHVFVTLMVRAPSRPCNKAGVRCMGGGRTFNGAPGTGGGFIQMEAGNLLDGKHFQSTLIHELGHAFGLSHADCHGQSMRDGFSIMSYNHAHWSRGLVESQDPGGFTGEDLVTLARNRLVFPHLAQSPQVVELAGRPLVRANGECHQKPMDGTIGPLQPRLGAYGQPPPGQPPPGQPPSGAPGQPPPTPWQAPQAPMAPVPQAPMGQSPIAAQPGKGYELFYDGRRVSGPDAQFYTRQHAQEHCSRIARSSPQTRVTCSFDGVPLTP